MNTRDMKYQDQYRTACLRVDKAIRERDYTTLDELWWQLRGWEGALVAQDNPGALGDIRDLLHAVELAEAEQSRRYA